MLEAGLVVRLVGGCTCFWGGCWSWCGVGYCLVVVAAGASLVVAAAVFLGCLAGGKHGRVLLGNYCILRKF